MALDSKDSDIEQLRSQLQALHIGLDSSSIGSGPGDAEADDGFPGMDFFSALRLFLLNDFVLKMKQLIVLSPVIDSALEKNVCHFFKKSLLLGVGIQMTV